MKLRNKKTGEKGDFLFESIYNRIDLYRRECNSPTEGILHYNSLAELNEEWEDVEKLKVQWFIKANGEVTKTTIENPFFANLAYCEQIGNLFDSKGEAEKAVEKLKAVKRLKDKGFRFNPNYSADGAIINHKDVILCRFEAYYDDYGEEDNIEADKDLNLLFGGEE